MSFYERFARRLSDPHICDPAPPPLLLPLLIVVKCCRQLTRATKKHNPKTITNIPLRHICVVFQVRRQLSLYPSHFLSICLSHSFPASVIKVCITFYCSLKRSLCRIRGTCTHMLPFPCLPPDPDAVAVAVAEADLDRPSSEPPGGTLAVKFIALNNFLLIPPSF